MRGGVSTELDPEELLARVREHPVLDGCDLASEAAGPARALGTDGPRVVAIDCGMKESIAQGLVGAGCRLQRQAGGRVSPESFTHGTSEQRMRWFEAGFRSGSADRCDTFSASSL
jgi:hypothetical protein